MTTDRKAGWGKAVLVAISGEFVHLWSAVQCLARTRAVTRITIDSWIICQVRGRAFIVASVEELVWALAEG